MLAGYPVVDVKVTLTFGSYHEVDSNENAFKMAASFGFKDGCRKASPVILEPMMAVEVETPEDFAGNVMGDLSSRRGMVQGMDDMVGGGKIIKAEVPLSEMFGYSTTLRSMSQGPRDLHDGIQALQRGAEERRRRDHHRARQQVVDAELRNESSRSSAGPVCCQWQANRSSAGNLKQATGTVLLSEFLKWQRANLSGRSRT